MAGGAPRQRTRLRRSVGADNVALGGEGQKFGSGYPKDSHTCSRHRTSKAEVTRPMPIMQRDILICGVQFDSELKSGAMSVLDLATIATKHGAQGVVYREVYWKDKAKELPEVRAQLDAMGLKRTYATFTTLFNRDPAKQKQLLQDLDDAHAIGAPLMRVFRGDPPGDIPDDRPILAATRAVIDRAAAYGMRLALENHIGAFGNHMSDVKGTIDRLNSPVLGANIDTSNYFINHQNPVDAVHLLAPWIIYTHLKDARDTAEGLKATYLGNGIIPIGAIVAALDQTGRDFPFTFEFGGEGDPEGAIAKSMAYLKAL